MNAKELCGVANAKLDTFVTWTALDRSNLSDGRKLAVNYFIVAVILFFAQLLFFQIFYTVF